MASTGQNVANVATSSIAGFFKGGWKGLKGAGLGVAIGLGIMIGGPFLIATTAWGVVGAIVGGGTLAGLSIAAAPYLTGAGMAIGAPVGAYQGVQANIQSKAESQEIARENANYRLNKAAERSQAVTQAVSAPAYRAPAHHAPMPQAAPQQPVRYTQQQPQRQQHAQYAAPPASAYQMHNHMAEGKSANHFTSRVAEEKHQALKQAQQATVGL